MKKEVELDFNTLIALTEHWDGVNPPFDEVVRSALMQATLMRRGERFIQELSEKTEVGGATITRYARGVSRPMPGMMRVVVSKAREILLSTREQYTRENSEIMMYIRHGAFWGDDLDSDD